MHVPQVRRPALDFNAELPRWWFANSRLRTHLANGLNFVFPAGERFFIRSVQHYQAQITDPILQARVAGFVGQEAQHQRAHLAAFRVLEEQGFEIKALLSWYEDLAYRDIEPRFPPSIRLATTAALEHFTSTFGELALGTEMLKDAHPTYQALLRWHAAEEIEHRDVAYDVLQQVAPSYWIRAAGFFIGLGCVFFFWRACTRHLLKQDAPDTPAAEALARQQVRQFWRQHGPGALRRLFAYLQPNFHPNKVQTDALAQDYLVALNQAG